MLKNVGRLTFTLITALIFLNSQPQQSIYNEL